jgi:Ca2+-binding RTX toxin-like protein
MSDTNSLEIKLGGQDVLLTNGFTSRVAGNYLSNGIHFDTRYQSSVNGEEVSLYVKGGSGDPDPSDVTLLSSALQLYFSAAMYGAAPVVGNFSIKAWSNGTPPGLTSVDSVNVKQGLYFGFNAAVTEPLRIDYTGTLADETGRGFLHKTWGVGTDGNDALDASSWTVAAAILGGGGNDAITGGANADLLIGGLGSDLLTGGLGSDRFVYKTVYQGVGGAGGLGGLTGDVITDFNTSLGKDADVLDMSDLFASSLGATGQASSDATKLIQGGYIDLVKTNTGKDLQVFVDRDGGGAMGLLVTLQNVDSYMTSSGETTEQLLQRLLTEGRMQVTHA